MVEIKDSYKISQVADFFGVSSDTIRFYDKLSILSPEKAESNNYRKYTWPDIVDLEYILDLKLLNLPLTEINKIVNEYDIKEIYDTMAAQEILIENQIEELNYSRKMVREYMRHCQYILETEGKPSICMSPTFILRKLDKDLKGTMKDLRRLTHLQKPIFTFRTEYCEDFLKCCTYDDYVEKIRNTSRVAFSLVDDDGIIDSQMIKDSDKFEIVESKLCSHILLRVAKGGEPDMLNRVASYAIEQGYTPYGEMLGKMISLSNRQKGGISYYDVWLPIK